MPSPTPSLDTASIDTKSPCEPSISAIAEPKRDRLRIDSIRSICCIGAGYVRGIFSSIMAAKHPNIQLTVVDVNEELIASWNSENVPFAEPGLKDLIGQVHLKSYQESPPRLSTGNLQFTTNVQNAVSNAQAIFICVDTPTRLDSDTRRERPDLSSFNEAIKTVASNVRSDFILVEKSTVPFGNARRIKSLIGSVLESQGLDLTFEILSIPEFFAEGTAVRDLLHPSRVLIGSERTATGLQASGLVAELYRAWVPHHRIVAGISTMSAELSKLAANAMLAQRISSINALSAACSYEQSNADIRDVSRAVGMDTRLGPHMLQASIGYGGSCLSKDVNILASLYDDMDMPELAEYWRAVEKVNAAQKRRFVDTIIRNLTEEDCIPGKCVSTGSSSSGRPMKRVAILGIAFKAGTKDTRNSPSIQIIQKLLEHGYAVRAFDRLVSQYDAAKVLRPISREQSDRLSIHCSVLDACTGVDAVVVATRDQFCSYDTESMETVTVMGSASVSDMLSWRQVREAMEVGSRFIFDGTASLDVPELTAIGFRVLAVGTGLYDSS